MNLFNTFIKLLKIFRQYLGRKMYLVFVISTGSAFAEGFGITLLLPLSKVVEDSGIPEGKLERIFYNVLVSIGVEDSLIGILVVIGVVFLTKGLLVFAQKAYSSYLMANLMKELKIRMFDAYSKMNYLYYTTKNSGHFINIINGQIGGLCTSFTALVNFTIKVIVTIVYLGLALFITWEFALMAIFSGAVMLFSFQFISNYILKLSRKTSMEMGHHNKLIVQTLQAFKYIISTHQIEHLGTKISQNVNKLRMYQFNQQLASSVITSIKEPLSVMFIIGIVIFQVMVLDAPIAPIFVAILLFYRSIGSIIAIQSHWQNIMNRMGSIEMVTSEFIALDQNKEKNGNKKLGPLSKGIEICNVSFAYEKTLNNVLMDINLFISFDKTIAFVGESGAGKSTLIDLLTLLLRPTNGSLLIDGVDSNNINLASWRQQIGYVSQETVVFDDTIKNNICLWENSSNSNTSMIEAVKTAAGQAHIAEFIETLPEGYNTLVGDRGIRLSGGQRQRLFIARELFKQPNLLILDEATSSLDTESELHIQKSIDALKGKMAVVLIAHRLSTVRNVDYIYVLDKGEVIEKGTYQELRNNKQSHFCKMVEMQVL